MKCPNCNNVIQDGTSFCPNCGTSLQGQEPVKKISLKCANCNGVLTVDSDKSVLVCPYCGARELIVENDAVKIEQIRANTQRDIEMERIRSAENQQLRAEANTQRQAERNAVEIFKKGKFAKFLLIAFVVSVLFSILSFSLSHILAGVFAVVQAGCFGVAWCMGMQIIKEKKRYIHILIAVAGILLLIPIMQFSVSNNKKDNAVKTDWSIFFLGDEIPKPTSDEMEIHTNTSDELWVDVVNTSDEEYYKYIAKCKEMGYTFEASETSMSYDAYNENGYKISLSHYSYNDEMSIQVDAPTQMGELDWDTRSIAEILPAPNSNIGSLVSENKDSTTVIVGKISSEQYEDYCSMCKEKGFVVDAKDDNTSYSAYNEVGYKVTLSYTAGNKEMKIVLDSPMEFSSITLPTVGISALIPVPPSLSGKEGSNYAWTYSVYLENMAKDDYLNYVQQCTQAGFEKDVSVYENSYWAKYKSDEDISIHVEYKGNNIVYIDITGSINGDYSNYKRSGVAAESTSSSEKVEETPSSSTSSSAETTTSISTTTPAVTEPQTVSEYEKTFVRDLSNYDIYYMFDEDNNTVIYFSTNDTFIMKGTYSGDFSTGVTIDFTAYGDGWYEKLTNKSGKKATLIDGNGLDWEYEVCDVSQAQKVLDNLS